MEKETDLLPQFLLKDELWAWPPDRRKEEEREKQRERETERFEGD